MRCGSATGAERLDGVASFGRRPTFDNGAPLLEVFLFDFKGDLYGTGSMSPSSLSSATS
jgi:FAD synthase